MSMISSAAEARQACADLDAWIATLEVTSAPEPLIVDTAATAPPPEAANDAAFAFGDYGAFYDWLRNNHMIGPTISVDEFAGCDAIVKACATAGWPIAYTAYALATAYHETAHTMQPIHERGGANYFTRMYDIRGNRPHVARELGNVNPGDGARFHGRGYVQLTGRRNYAKATAELQALGINVDLIANPDRALEPMIAATIMVLGMQHGWFTTRKLSDDLPASGPASSRQFLLSRDIINGRDKDDEIAGYAVDWQQALQAGTYRIAA